MNVACLLHLAFATICKHFFPEPCLTSNTTSNRGRRQLAAAEGRLGAADERQSATEAELRSLQQRHDMLAEALRGLEGEHAALRDEYRAVSEDLEALVRGSAPLPSLSLVCSGMSCGRRQPVYSALRRRSWHVATDSVTLPPTLLTGSLCFYVRAQVRENQVVSTELASAAAQRDGAHGELRKLQAQLTSLEQMVRLKDSEVEDLRHAYEAAAAEGRRAASAVAQLEREAAGREMALKVRQDEVAALQDAQRAAQSEINRYIVDLQVGGWAGAMLRPVVHAIIPAFFGAVVGTYRALCNRVRGCMSAWQEVLRCSLHALRLCFCVRFCLHQPIARRVLTRRAPCSAPRRRTSARWTCCPASCPPARPPASAWARSGRGCWRRCARRSRHAAA